MAKRAGAREKAPRRSEAKQSGSAAGAGSLQASPAAGEPIEANQDAIARRAYEIYCERGCQHGHELDDWLQAESELRGR